MCVCDRTSFGVRPHAAWSDHRCAASHSNSNHPHDPKPSHLLQGRLLLQTSQRKVAGHTAAGAGVGVTLGVGEAAGADAILRSGSDVAFDFVVGRGCGAEVGAGKPPCACVCACPRE